MTKNESRRSISPLKDEVIKYIENYFELYYRANDSCYQFLDKEAYRILDTDFHIQYYKDETIQEIFLCTWAGGWGHQQSSIKIEFSWNGYYDYRICDKSGKETILSEYKSDKGEDIFIALGKVNKKLLWKACVKFIKWRNKHLKEVENFHNEPSYKNFLKRLGK